MEPSERYRRLEVELKVCASTIIEDLLCAVKTDPDKVRDVLGSVSWRKLEEYKSLEEQENAVFEEWVHASTSVNI